MMRNPRNLLIFAVLGGLVGLALGFGLGSLFRTAAQNETSPANAEAEIRKVLNAQTESWNSGNIEAYMADYVTGDALRFASGGTVESGWQETLDRYLRRYPDRATMGTLLAENLDVDILGPEDALVFGTWELEREGDNPSGLYTLHMRKIEGRWLIVSDHTSSGE